MEELKIGIIAEGISDYWVIKHIIARFLKDKEINIIPLQPKIMPAHKQYGYGGWQKVFEYISKKEYIIDLAQTEGFDYIIVQIDTDVCEEYGVVKEANLENLFCNVKNKISETTHPDFNIPKIIPAICIHSIECWLIPFVSDDTQKCSKIDNCINAVNHEIRTVGKIDKKDKSKAKRLYDFILDKKKKQKEIQAIAQYNFGFSKFLENLEKLA